MSDPLDARGNPTSTPIGKISLPRKVVFATPVLALSHIRELERERNDALAKCARMETVVRAATAYVAKVANDAEELNALIDALERYDKP